MAMHPVQSGHNRRNVLPAVAAIAAVLGLVALGVFAVTPNRNSSVAPVATSTWSAPSTTATSAPSIDTEADVYFPNHYQNQAIKVEELPPTF